MQTVLSQGLWKAAAAAAKKAKLRRGAIAYVTRDLVGFRKGDALVVNACKNAIASGETDAKLLRTLLERGVNLYSCPDLHAKILLLGDVAVIGSGNMSESSARMLIEAGLLTDSRATTSAIASLIEQLIRRSEALDASAIERLCKIKVVRRGGQVRGRKALSRKQITPLGSSTWIVGIQELAHDPPPAEQRLIDQAIQQLSDVADPDEGLSWIRYPSRARFAREGRQGDSVIQIWRSAGAKRVSAVLRAVPVLLKQRTKTWTRFYLGDASGSPDRMTWGRFQKLAKGVGHMRQLGPGVTQRVDPDAADAIQRKWRTAAKA